MSEFVKLTGAYGNGAFYINVQRVESFYDRKDGGTYVCTTPDGDQAYEVTETPEQIMALIDGPADRDALVETLRVCREQFAFYVEQHKAKGTLDGDEEITAERFAKIDADWVDQQIERAMAERVGRSAELGSVV